MGGLNGYLFSDGYYKSVQDLSYRLQADGSQKYERHTWSKGLGLISDKVESVQVTPDGKETCQVKDQSPQFSNWQRQNPSLNKLAALTLGAAVGGIVGYCLGGGAAAAFAAPAAAAFAGSVAKGFQADNSDAPLASRERGLATPVNVLVTCAQTVGAGAAVLGGLLLLGQL